MRRLALAALLIMAACTTETQPPTTSKPKPTTTTRPATEVVTVPTTIDYTALGQYLEALTTTTAPPTTAPPATRPPTTEAPVVAEVADQPSTASSGANWDALAQCESGGNWAHPPVGSYGYSGGLMFLPSTWRAYGGTAYASAAHLATREQQIAVAERVLADVGRGAWPGCSAAGRW